MNTPTHGALWICELSAIDEFDHTATRLNAFKGNSDWICARLSDAYNAYCAAWNAHLHASRLTSNMLIMNK